MASHLEFPSIYPPCRARVHEACGAGRYAFACDLSARQSDPVLWIYQKTDGTPYYHGLAAFDAAEKLYFVHSDDHKTQLWCMEEALASGAIGLVICENATPVSFRDMRRLQLAAERGGSLGILMTPETMSNPATETRWRCQPIFDACDHSLRSALQSWSLLKNKRGPLGQWKVNWDEKTHRFALV